MCTLEGSWLDRLLCDGQLYWSMHHDRPSPIVPLAHLRGAERDEELLSSDSWKRSDLAAMRNAWSEEQLRGT